MESAADATAGRRKRRKRKRKRERRKRRERRRKRRKEGGRERKRRILGVFSTRCRPRECLSPSIPTPRGVCGRECPSPSF